MDSLTASRRNLEFARVCVEVNLEEKLPEEILVKLRDGSKARVEVEYTWKPSKCDHCKIVGHVEDYCPMKTKQSTHEAPQKIVTNAPKPKESDEWIVIVKNKSTAGNDHPKNENQPCISPKKKATSSSQAHSDHRPYSPTMSSRISSPMQVSNHFRALEEDAIEERDKIFQKRQEEFGKDLAHG